MGKKNGIGRQTLRNYINYDLNDSNGLPKLGTARLIALALDVEMNEILTMRIFQILMVVLKLVMR